MSRVTRLRPALPKTCFTPVLLIGMGHWQPSLLPHLWRGQGVVVQAGRGRWHKGAATTCA